MTTIQAIDVLKGLEQSLDDYCELNDEGKTAFGMAITALELFGNSEQLSSAQPEVRTQMSSADDLISRQAAIDALAKQMPRSYTPDGSRPADEVIFMAQEIYADCITTIERLPSAQPERKKGKWVGYDGDWLKTMCKCSKCGAMIDINEKYRNFFCYHCGADMREEDT